ncbi:MAG: SAM-dependent methyltransferase [Betaproteobacteria bacterium]
MTAGALFLVPVPLGDMDPALVLSAETLEIVRRLDGYIAEEPKTARAFLKRLGIERPLSDVRIDSLNEHTSADELPKLLAPMAAGARVGMLSEAGYPAVADPGGELVFQAHLAGIRVVPLVGPSSLILALAASGLNGQRFVCHGYLPVAAEPRTAAIRSLESQSGVDGGAQIFIETPYRNNQLLAALLEICHAQTRLCLATELTSPHETIRTDLISGWRRRPPDLNRRPTVFVLQAAPAARLSAETTRRSGAAVPQRSRSRSAAPAVRRYFRAG